jgi:hypothetical protein
MKPSTVSSLLAKEMLGEVSNFRPKALLPSTQRSELSAALKASSIKPFNELKARPN